MKGFLAFFAIIASFIGSFFGAHPVTTTSTTPIASTTTSVVATATAIIVAPTSTTFAQVPADWNTYTNATAGFSFRYPPDFNEKPLIYGNPPGGVEVLINGKPPVGTTNTPNSDLILVVNTNTQGTSSVENDVAAISKNPSSSGCGGTVNIATTTIEGEATWILSCTLNPQLNTPPQYILGFYHNQMSYRVMLTDVPSASTWVGEIGNSFVFTKNSTPSTSQTVNPRSSGFTISPSAPTVFVQGGSNTISWSGATCSAEQQNLCVSLSLESAQGSCGAPAAGSPCNVGLVPVPANKAPTSGSFIWNAETVCGSDSPSGWSNCKAVTPGVYRVYAQDYNGTTVSGGEIVISAAADTSAVNISSGRDAERISNLHEIQNMLELYYNKCGFYPGSANCSAQTAPTSWSAFGSAFTGTGSLGITSVPNDPLGGNATYIYGVNGSGANYILEATLENSSSISGFGSSNYTSPTIPTGMIWTSSIAPTCTGLQYCVVL